MDRRLVSGLALAAGFAAAACTDRPQDQDLQGPSSVANIITQPCDPSVFNSLIAGYFSPPQMQRVKGFKDLMLAELNENPADSIQARVHGFDILREIGLAAKGVPQPSPATGSQLAVEVLECIYDVTDEDVIESKPGTGFFIDALTRQGGGFAVRGGEDDSSAAVQASAGDPLVVISGIAPPAPQTGGWWDDALDGQRVLFYGERGSSPGSYHWSVVPRGASFDPSLVVTTCIDDEDFNDPNLMLTETGVGVLAFVDATYLGCGGAPAIAGTISRFDVLRHLATLGRTLFVPEPAVAAAVMPGVVGGSAKGVKSLFDIQSVGTVELSVTQQPPKTANVNTPFPVKFQARTPRPDRKTVNGTTITVAAVNNNGTPTSLVMHPAEGASFECGGSPLPPCSLTTTSISDDEHGVAEFRLSVTKAGAVIITATGGVDERKSQVVGVQTNKMNIKP